MAAGAPLERTAPSEVAGKLSRSGLVFPTVRTQIRRTATTTSIAESMRVALILSIVGGVH